MARRNYNVRLTRNAVDTSRYATSLKDMSTKAQVRHLKTNGTSDEYKNWFDLPTEKIGGAVAQVVERIDAANYDQRNRMMMFARLYGNYETLGWSSQMSGGNQNSAGSKPVYNVVQSSIDTVNSKIARDNPQPYFITSGADYFDKLKAEKQTMFVQGIFQQCGLYDIANNDVFRDGCTYGLGGIEWSLNPRTNEIEAEWVFIDELKVDRLDGAKGKPKSIHRVVMLSKEELLERYKDDEEALEKIERVSTQRPVVFRGQDSVVDFVVIRKSWHLAVGKKPGRYVVTIDDEVLEDQEWKHDWFPFSFFRWMKKVAGFIGRGIPEELWSGQEQINRILYFIQQCQELQASPLIFVPTEAQVAEDALMSNNIARMVPYRGTTLPTFISPQSTGPEIYQNLKDWIAWCYGKVGISQTSASGTKQAGVNSAVAMRTMVDVESSRFIQVSKNWEAFFVECAEIVVKLGKQAYEKDTKFAVDYTDQRSKIIKTIPWSKINVTDDAFVIRCDTISGFPSTAAGRIQTVTDFISNHFISLERGMELLNIDPDLEDEVKLATSSLRLCEKALSEMVEDAKYSHPEKYMNLKLGLAVSLATYNQLRLDGCPEDRLQLVRQWVDEIASQLGAKDPQLQLLQSMFQPAGPQAPAPTTAPQAGLQPVQQAA